MSAVEEMAPAHESLTDALVAAQAEMPAVPKTAKANYGNYATLDSLIALTRPVLNRHGLAITQLPGWIHVADNPAPTLRTILIHGSSGDSMESEMLLILGKTDMQNLGSAMTYAKRYAWSAVLGISADDDDDGTTASPDNQPRQQQRREERIERLLAAEPRDVENLRSLLLEEGLDDETIEKGFAAGRRANGGDLSQEWVNEKTDAAIERQSILDAQVEAAVSDGEPEMPPEVAERLAETFEPSD